jgi:hypothetical protein
LDKQPTITVASSSENKVTSFVAHVQNIECGVNITVKLTQRGLSLKFALIAKLKIINPPILSAQEDTVVSLAIQPIPRRSCPAGP